MKTLFHIIAKANGCILFTIHELLEYKFSKKCLKKNVGSLGSKAKQTVLNVWDYFLKECQKQKDSVSYIFIVGPRYIVLVSVVELYIELRRN